MTLAAERPSEVEPRSPGTRDPLVRGGIGEVVVVVPVHDEQALIGACLRSVRTALDHPRLRGVPSRIVVALDSCQDGSGDEAARALGPLDQIVTVDVRNVGAARAAGTEHGLATIGVAPGDVWLAHTDADSTVPPHWLARQLTFAATADAVAGVVRVADWTPHDRRTRWAHGRHYHQALWRPHPHVHGANLGVRASAYLDVGGFPHLACSEDHALWDALASSDHVVRSSRRVWVTTSARRESRTAGGFADTLLELRRGLSPPRAGRPRSS